MKTSRILLGAAGASALGAALLCLPVSSGIKESGMISPAIQRLDLSGYPAGPLDQPLDVLFIHHSCGGQLLAAYGPSTGENCILKSDPNGGNLRALLQGNGYRVHEAAYGSQIGENTDVFDWLPKFRNQMHEILRCDHQDVLYRDGRRNRIVIFKSCFPNNAFPSEGTPPGAADGPELTVWNAKAAYTALLEEFRKRPEVLFVCVTAPPLAAGEDTQPLWKQLARKIKRTLRPAPYDLAASGPLARRFNSWLADTSGWLRDYPLKNVVVFDYYDILTDHGKSDFCRYPTWNGKDSHPSCAGNQKAAQAFAPFLNRSVRRAQTATAQASAR